MYTYKALKAYQAVNHGCNIGNNISALSCVSIPLLIVYGFTLYTAIDREYSCSLLAHIIRKAVLKVVHRI